MYSLRRMSVLLASAVAMVAAAAPVQAALAGPARAPRPGQWTQVTGKLSLIADVGLARGQDGVLHVLWTSGSTGTFRVSDTPVKADGVVGRPVTVASRLYAASDPDATATSAGVAAFWDGFKTSSSQSPVGTFEATRPSRGGSWRISGLTAGAFDWNSSVAAAPGTAGSPWTAFGDAAGINVDHVGHPAVDLGFSSCCVSSAGIGSDSRTGTAFATYLSTVTRHSGVVAQRLTAAGRRSGGPIVLPGSDMGGSPLTIQQRITATGLGGSRPGVYVAYRTGTPGRPLDVMLDRIGASRAIKIATFDATAVGSGSTLAADPFGRVWVAWFRGERNFVALWVRRAKTGASQFGQVERVGLPKGTLYVWKVYINAQAKKLDVVALMTVRGKVAYWATQVLPPRQ